MEVEASPGDEDDQAAFQEASFEGVEGIDDDAAADFLGSSNPISPLWNMAMNLRSSGSFSGLPSSTGVVVGGASGDVDGGDCCDDDAAATASDCEDEGEAWDVDAVPSADLFDQNQPIV